MALAINPAIPLGEIDCTAIVRLNSLLSQGWHVRDMEHNPTGGILIILERSESCAHESMSYIGSVGKDQWRCSKCGYVTPVQNTSCGNYLPPSKPSNSTACSSPSTKPCA